MQQDLSRVKYVGPTTVKRLAEHGIITVEQLAALSNEELAAIPGVGKHTAPLILTSAQQLLAVNDLATEAPKAKKKAAPKKPVVKKNPAKSKVVATEESQPPSADEITPESVTPVAEVEAPAESNVKPVKKPRSRKKPSPVIPTEAPTLSETSAPTTEAIETVIMPAPAPVLEVEVIDPLPSEEDFLGKPDKKVKKTKKGDSAKKLIKQAKKLAKEAKKAAEKAQKKAAKKKDKAQKAEAGDKDKKKKKEKKSKKDKEKKNDK